VSVGTTRSSFQNWTWLLQVESAASTARRSSAGILPRTRTFTIGCGTAASVTASRMRALSSLASSVPSAALPPTITYWFDAKLGTGLGR